MSFCARLIAVASLGLVAPTGAAVAVTLVPTMKSAPLQAAEKSGTYWLDRTITDDNIRESSGLAMSHFESGLLWTHNDSGGGQLIYAVAKSGSTAATVTLAGAGSRDWEDIASGPDHTLWVGDIGDNAEARTWSRSTRSASPLSRRPPRSRRLATSSPTPTDPTTPRP